MPAPIIGPCGNYGQPACPPVNAVTVSGASLHPTEHVSIWAILFGLLFL